jgi:hypothetical protein
MLTSRKPSCIHPHLGRTPIPRSNWRQPTGIASRNIAREPCTKKDLYRGCSTLVPVQEYGQCEGSVDALKKQTMLMDMHQRLRRPLSLCPGNWDRSESYPTTTSPPNLHFEVDDCTLDWLYTKESFDFIHTRSLYGCVSDWPAFYGQVIK